MLRNPDTSRTASRHSLRKLMLGMILTVALYGQPKQDLEQQLEAAIHRETVVGDLTGAIQLYQAVLAQSAQHRATAARALLQIAQCQERLGQRKDARAAYTRVAREFADQPRAAAIARARLAGWVDAAPGPRNLSFEEGTPGRTPSG